MDQSEVVAFTQEPPIIEIINGVVFIRCRHGLLPKRAMSIHTLQRLVERCQKALRLHAAGETTILVDE